MDKKSNIGFFRKLILSITDFRLYPYVVKNEKVLKSISHFILFVMLLVAIITTKYMIKLDNTFEYFISNYDEVMPDFTIVDGILNIQQNHISKISNNIGFAINTDYTYDEYIKSEHYQGVTKYDTRVLVNSDAINYENYTGAYFTVISFGELTDNYDKVTFYELLKEINNGFPYKLTIAFSIFISFFIVFLLYKLMDVIMYTVFASLISIIGGMKIDYKNYLKIVLYSLTLPFIVETISILYSGMIKDYAMIVSNILAFIYIYYAIRAVKLDAFLLIISNSKNAKKGNKQNSIVLDLNEESDKKEEREDSQDNNEESVNAENKDEQKHNKNEK